MLNHLRFLCVMFVSFVLVGCDTMPKVETKIVYITDVQYVIPGEGLLSKSPDVPPPPMASKEYSQLAARDKEAMLIAYIKDLFSGVIGPLLISNETLLKWRDEKQKEADKLKLTKKP